MTVIPPISAPLVIGGIAAAWRFRQLDRDGPGPWREQPCDHAAPPPAWAPAWRGRLLEDEHQAAPLVAAHAAGQALPGDWVALATDAAGETDLAPLDGGGGGRLGLLVAELQLVAASGLLLHVGCDWWMHWWLDGEPLYATPQGNGCRPEIDAHRIPLRLAPGQHRLAVMVRGGRLGWLLRCEAGPLPAAEGPAIEAVLDFTLDDATAYRSLSLAAAVDAGVSLNGYALAAAGEERRGWCHGLDPRALQVGGNRLSLTWDPASAAEAAALAGLRHFVTSAGRRKLAPAVTLQLHRAEDQRLRTGPVLGLGRDGSRQLACRTVARGALRCTTDAGEVTSAPALVHRFALPQRCRAWRIAAGPAGVLALGHLRGGDIRRVVVYGDPSPNPEVLEALLPRMHAERPDAAIFLGDAVGDGGDDEAWDRDFFARHPRWFATVPHLWVPGNHDAGAGAVRAFLGLPAGVPGWSAPLGPAVAICLDGGADWSVGGSAVRWLEAELRRHAGRERIVCNHYPGWSRTPHARLGADGRPMEREVAAAREVILPLCQRHGVRLYLNGHCHCYERARLDDLLMLTSGGAGGFLYDPVIDHPSCERFARRHHYLVLELADGIRISAKGEDGTEIDRVVLDRVAAYQ